MNNQKCVFTPLGIDHLTIACDDNTLWSQTLGRLGFDRVKAKPDKSHPFDAEDYDAYFGIAMALNHTRIFLADPHTKRFAKDSIKQFLRDHGNMQVVEVGIRIDSIRKAREECRDNKKILLIPQLYYGDTFGDCVAVRFNFSPLSSFVSTFVERRETFCAGIDHIAIAVEHLDRWMKHYQSYWGFEIIYSPHGQEEGLIKGEKSAMKTFALRRGGWTVALVEGVDRERTSQVTTYRKTHGNHSVQHAALIFNDLENTATSWLTKGVRFRLSGILSSPSERLTIDHILHRGEDYGGPLLQCFTKPFARIKGKGGFFFELIERISSEKKQEDKQAFHDPTVIGLFESIEREEMAGDTGLILSPV